MRKRNNRQAVALFAAVLGIGMAASAATDLRFSNVTVQAGIDHLYTSPTGLVIEMVGWMSGGAVAEDFDGDGDIDLYVLQGATSSNLLYINNGDGTFTNQAADWGADLSIDGIGTCAADYDNDGDIDICVTKPYDVPCLLVHDGTSKFSVVQLDTGLTYSVMSPSWGDVNGDGLLELAVGAWEHNLGALSLYHNNGVALTALDLGMATSELDRVFSPGFADFDGDRDADFPVVADFVESILLMNAGGGIFTNVTMTNKFLTDENGMGTAYGDYDNDGDLDWFISSIMGYPGAYSTTGNRLYQNDGSGVFADVTDNGVRDGGWGWGSAFGDLDNDGDLDLAHANGWSSVNTSETAYRDDTVRLFENLGDGTFTNVAAEAGVADPGQSRCLIMFDYDDDGDLDIFVVNNVVATYTNIPIVREPAPPILFRNDTVNSNHWLKVTLDGTAPFHSDGIGSRVYLTVGDTTQMRELNASTGFLGHGPNRIAHFGLSSNLTADEVRAEWVSGDAVVVSNVAADQAISIPSPAGAISARRVYTGDTVTLSSDGLTRPRRWDYDGQSSTNATWQVEVASAGDQEVLLTIFQLDGTTVDRIERIRVTAQSLEITGLDAAAAPLAASLSWNTISGRVYRLNVATSSIASGFVVFDTFTSLVTGVESVQCSNVTGAAFFQLELTPLE